MLYCVCSVEVKEKEVTKMAKAKNISLPDDVMERLDKESKALGLNRSAYISMALNQKWQNDEAIKALTSLSKFADKVDAVDQ